jgi:MYXO-CTERM domain-containing protein
VVRGGRGWVAKEGHGFQAKRAGVSVAVDDHGLQVGSEGKDGRGSSIKVASIGRDGARAVSSGVMRVQGSTLVIDRAVTEERYELVPSGVEQSFGFSQRPSGTGDLTVRLETSGLTGVTTKDGALTFTAGNREIRYGAATWVDATGRKTPVDTRYRAGHIVLTVPAAVVESAAYPAVLDPLISSKMVLATAARLPGGQAASIAVDCTTTTCLVAWTQDGQAVARRLKLDGTPLDTDVIVLGETSALQAGAGSLTVAATATDFLVTWANSYLAPDTFQWLSIAASTAAVSDVPPVSIAVAEDSYSVPRASVYGNGEQLLIHRQSFPPRYIGLRLVDGVVQAPTSGVQLSEWQNDEPVSVVAGPGQFAFVHRGQLFRIAAGTGALLDNAPIQFSKWGYTGTAGPSTVTYDGANYIVVWFDSGKLQATRVRASDGIVLDPDDDFNELPGSRVLCTAPGSNLTAAVEGGSLYVTWDSTAVYAQAFPLAPWTASAAACGTSAISNTGPSIRSQVGAKGLVLWATNSSLSATGFAVTAGSVVSSGNPGVINYAQAAGAPFVASNGRDFMFSAVRSVPGGEYPTFLQAIDGATGEPMSGAMQVDSNVGFQAQPIYASSSSYLLITDKARKLSCDGSELGEGKELLQDQSLYAVTSDGNQYFALTTQGNAVNGYRIDLDGNPIDSPSKQLLPEHTGFLAAGANDELPASMRTFTALARTPTGFAVLRMRSATGAVLAPIPVDLASDAMPNMVATDGTNMVLGWNQAGAPSEVDAWTALFDPTTGTLTNKKKWAVPGVAGLAFDGASYVQLLQWVDHTNTVRRFDPALAQLDAGNGFDVPVPINPVHASNRYGRTLFVAAEYNAKDLGTRLVGYFVDNELAPSDPDNAPVTCFPSNEGGSGGEGGLGGGTGQAGEGGTAGTSVGGTGNAGTSPGGADAGGTDGGGADSGGTDSGGTDSGGADGGGAPSSGAPSGGVASAGANNAAGQNEGGSSNGGSSSTAGSSTAGSDGNEGSDDSSGCGCRTTPSTPKAPWALLLLGASALVRRRRRR